MSIDLSKSKTLILLKNSNRPLSLWPLSVWNAKDVAIALYSGEIEPVYVSSRGYTVHSPSQSIDIPLVAKLTFPGKLRWKATVRFNLTNLYVRDQALCAYCGRKTIKTNIGRPEMATFDHVYPKSRGGTETWGNAVLACQECNVKKANKTPEEAGMLLRFGLPWHPSPGEMLRLAISLGERRFLHRLINQYADIPECPRVKERLEMLAV